MRVQIFGDAELKAISLLKESLPFSENAKILGLDPLSDFRSTDLTGVDFTDSDLRNFDFTGADLSDTDGNNIKMDASTILTNAIVSRSPFALEAKKRKLLADPRVNKKFTSLMNGQDTTRSLFLLRKASVESADKIDKAIGMLLLQDDQSTMTQVTALYVVKGMLSDEDDMIEFVKGSLCKYYENPLLVVSIIKIALEPFSKKASSRKILIDLISDTRAMVSFRAFEALGKITTAEREIIAEIVTSNDWSQMRYSLVSDARIRVQPYNKTTGRPVFLDPLNRISESSLQEIFFKVKSVAPKSLPNEPLRPQGKKIDIENKTLSVWFFEDVFDATGVEYIFENDVRISSLIRTYYKGQPVRAGLKLPWLIRDIISQHASM